MINKLVDKKLVPLSTEELEEYNQRLANAPSEFDMAMEDLRAKRNNLLKETDHYALSDVTMSEDMTTYRQNLRDLTNGLTTVEQVEAVTWPTKPGA
tara:strand:+ start:396 stop:683 length:288 start_codon:yes stop_codon:yes gene_type:complete